MRRLLLMRHAKTEKDGPTGKDRDRRLDDRGRDDAEAMGVFLAQQDLLPDLALVSTAVRARQTWDQVAAAWANIQPKIQKIQVDHLDELYAADPGSLLGIVHAAAGDDPQRLLVVAHNPGLHEFALALVAGGNIKARQALLDNLPTSGLAVIDFTIEDWGDVSFRRGRLERFVSPRLLKEASGRDAIED
jgi:phosphohistidine phosphatase